MVFSLEKARPTRPLEAVSEMNEEATEVGRPMAWDATVAPPMLTASVPTGPRAKEPSPYEMLKVEPVAAWKVVDLVGS